MPSLREWHGTPLAETGQEFTREAVERAVELTAGQPWLVNALANEVVEELAARPPSRSLWSTSRRRRNG
jgi:hypothetical protein